MCLRHFVPGASIHSHAGDVSRSVFDHRNTLTCGGHSPVRNSSSGASCIVCLFGAGDDGNPDNAAGRVLDRHRPRVGPEHVCPGGSVHARSPANKCRRGESQPRVVHPSMVARRGGTATMRRRRCHDRPKFMPCHRGWTRPDAISPLTCTATRRYRTLSPRARPRLPSGATGFGIRADISLKGTEDRTPACRRKSATPPPPVSEQSALRGMNNATNQVSNRFDCLGLTLEIPYKDRATNPDPVRGFSLERCKKRLGSNLAEVLVDVHPYLRAEGEFRTAFSEEDDGQLPTLGRLLGCTFVDCVAQFKYFYKHACIQKIRVDKTTVFLWRGNDN